MRKRIARILCPHRDVTSDRGVTTCNHCHREV